LASKKKTTDGIVIEIAGANEVQDLLNETKDLYNEVSAQLSEKSY